MKDYYVAYGLVPLRGPQVIEEEDVESAIREYLDRNEDTSETVWVWVAEVPPERGGTVTWTWNRYRVDVEVQRTFTIRQSEPAPAADGKRRKV